MRNLEDTIGVSVALNWRMTDNTMAKRDRDKKTNNDPKRHYTEN